MEFLTIVIAGGLFNLTTNLVDASLDFLGLAAAVDKNGIFFLNQDAGRGTEISDLNSIELHTEVFGDESASGKDGDVFHHGFAAVTEAWGLDSGYFQIAANAVHHKSG